MQDTPALRANYSARIDVSNKWNVIVLMSANKTGREVVDNNTAHFFEQNYAIPSYLVGMVAGDLSEYNITANLTVWAEPSMLEKVSACMKYFSGAY